MIATIDAGLQMILYFDDELSWLIYNQDFERKERHFVRRYLRPGDVFVDAGANIGLYTLIAARCVGANGRVYSFEPCGKSFRRLRASVEINHFTNVLCYQVALSNRAGLAELTVSLDGHDAWNTLAHPTCGTLFDRETVPCVTWDELANEHHLVGKVAMMKIDVEGWESPVLQGASETLSRPDAPVLQVEFTDEASQAAGSSCEQLYRLLEGLGYQMYVYDALYAKLIRERLRDAYPYSNLIAAKNEDRVMERIHKCHTLYTR